MGDQISIARWDLENYTFITEASMTGAGSSCDRVRLLFQTWREKVKKPENHITCFMEHGRFYCGGYKGVYVPYLIGNQFIAANVDEVATDLERQVAKNDWAMWRPVSWANRRPVILGAKLFLMSRELTNPNEDAYLLCLVIVSEYDGHQMSMYLNWKDGKLYWANYTPFDAINADEAMQALSTQATEWAAENG